MTTPSQADKGDPQHINCQELCQPHQQQDQQQPAEQVLRVVLGGDPSRTSSSGVLRPFHTVCSEGHVAALRTIRHLHLERCVELGVPYERQLCVLSAADQTTSLTISSSQIEGLVACLLQQQHKEEEVEEQQQVKGVQQSLEELVVDRAAPADDTPSNTNTSSSNAAGAATSHPTLPAAKPHGPYFRLLTVVGPVEEAMLLHLEQLLDLLPGTQHLQQVVWKEAADEPLLAYYMAVWTCLSQEEPVWALQVGPRADAVQSRRQPVTNSSSSTCSSSDPPGRRDPAAGWRSSCQKLAVTRQDGTGEPLTIAHLAPLLGSFKQLRVLYLSGVSVQELPQHTASLEGLQSLHLTGHCGPEVLACVAGLTDLRHLGLWQCHAGFTASPAIFSCLVHLTSLDLSCWQLTEEALEGVCRLTSLRALNLNASLGPHTLPPSISNLVRLVGLGVRLSDVGSLPECLTTLTALQCVSWSQRAATDPLPLEVVWRLKGLRHLDIADDHLTALPEDIHQLTGLSSLVAKVQALTALPTGVSALVALKCLDLNAPRLRALPQGITALTRLRKVIARGVQLPDQSPAVQAFLAARQAQGCVLELAPADSGNV